LKITEKEAKTGPAAVGVRVRVGEDNGATPLVSVLLPRAISQNNLPKPHAISAGL
jgi:hypothetical protein